MGEYPQADESASTESKVGGRTVGIRSSKSLVRPTEKEESFAERTGEQGTGDSSRNVLSPITELKTAAVPVSNAERPVELTGPPMTCCSEESDLQWTLDSEMTGSE